MINCFICRIERRCNKNFKDLKVIYHKFSVFNELLGKVTDTKANIKSKLVSN